MGKKAIVQDRAYDILGNFLDSQRPYIQNKGKVYELINYGIKLPQLRLV